MPQEQNIITDMTTIQEGGVLSAVIKYNGNIVNPTSDPLVTVLTLLPNILPASQNTNNIKQTVGQQDGISYKEGEVIVAIRGTQNVSIDINDKGEATINAEDGLRYSIDDEGNLIYDYTIPIKDFPY